MNELGKTAALDALSGKPAARVPFALLTWGYDYIWQCAGIEPWRLALGSSSTWLEAYVATYERHKPDIVVFNSFGGFAADPILLEETFESWVVRSADGEEWDFIKSSYTLRHRPKSEQIPGPPQRWDTIDDIDNNVGRPSSKDPGPLDGLSAVVEATGDKALVLATCSPGYIAACYTLGFDRSMEMMLDEPELFIYLCDRLSENDDRTMRQFAQSGAEAVLIVDSWASCDILSPQMARQFALPYQKKTVDAARAAGLKPILWNCGDVGPILADEAALDIDAFAFEQPRKNFAVTVSQAREVFGPHRCLFGNLDSEHMLMRNDRDEITDAVLSQIGESGEGSPFVLFFGSPIPSGTPESAVDAVVDAVRGFSWD